MLRITAQGKAAARTCLKLEGTVSGRWVHELQKCCQEAQALGLPLAMDLRDVSYIDRQGVALLRMLTRQGVEMRLSNFAAEQLKEHCDVESSECV